LWAGKGHWTSVDESKGKNGDGLRRRGPEKRLTCAVFLLRKEEGIGRELSGDQRSRETEAGKKSKKAK